MSESSGPCEDRGDWVSASVLALLPEAVVTGDSTVSSFSFDDIILIDENGGHETERTETLSDDIRLDITVVVLASPHKAALHLDDLGNHIINESVLVVNTLLLELLNELSLINMLEDVLEETVVFLQNGVLCGELKWVASVEGILHASSSEAVN